MTIFYKLDVGRAFPETPTLKGTSDTFYSIKLCVFAWPGQAAETQVVRGPEGHLQTTRHIGVSIPHIQASFPL